MRAEVIPWVEQEVHVPKVIQFIHPGPQPPPELVAGNRKGWNRLPRHYRSFIEARGEVMSDLGQRAEAHDHVRFWGEWEADADIVQVFRQPLGPDEPEMCIRPRVTKPAEFAGHQNTDPFVSDGPFVYCICQQPSKPLLRALARGDLILFGSSKGGQFLLDTVFVVASGEPYRPGVNVPADAPASFRAVTDWPLSQGATNQACADTDGGCVSEEKLRYYRGATPEQPLAGMFSFTPAILPGTARHSFRRPAIAPTGPLEDRVNPALTQGVKKTDVTTGESTAVWQEVLRQVRAEQLLLGVAFRT